MREEKYFMPEREPDERFGLRDAGPLSLRDLVVMSLAFIMPTIPFALYGTIMTASHGASASAFWLAAVTVGLSAFSFIRLSRTWPGPASVYNAVASEFHPSAGFVTGWALFLFYLLVPASAVIMSAKLISDSSGIPAVVVIISFTVFAFAVNYLGPRMASRVCLVALFLIIAFTLIFIFVGILAAAKGAGVGHVISSVPYKGVGAGFGSVLMGSGVVVLAFLGFESSITLSAEAERDRNLIGKAVVITCVIAGILIFLQLVVSGLIIPYSKANADVTLLDVALTAGGKALVILYSTAIILAGLLAAVAGQSAAARMMYALGRAGAIPRHIFARRDANPNPNRKLPLINLILVSLLMLLLCILSSQLPLLVGLSRFMGAFVFIAINLTMLFYGYFGKNDGNIITGLVVPALGFLGCLAAWINVAPKHFVIGIVVLVAGVVLSVVIKDAGGRPDSGLPHPGKDAAGKDAGARGRREKREKDILADKEFRLPRRDRRF
jgi:amino acid transporter